jgi:hypothetical protein
LNSTVLSVYMVNNEGVLEKSNESMSDVWVLPRSLANGSLISVHWEISLDKVDEESILLSDSPVEGDPSLSTLWKGQRLRAGTTMPLRTKVRLNLGENTMEGFTWTNISTPSLYAPFISPHPRNKEWSNWAGEEGSVHI